MRGSTLPTSPVRALTLAAAIAAFGVAAAPAQAVTKTLAYSCVWPNSEPLSLSVSYDAAVASTSPVGKPTGDTPVNVRIASAEETLYSVYGFGAIALDGYLTADAKITGPGVAVTKPLRIDLERTLVPGVGKLPFSGSGSFGSTTFGAAGATSVELGAPRLTLIALGEGGTPFPVSPSETTAPQTDGDPNTLEVPCQPAVAGQDAVLATGTAAASSDVTAPAAPGRPTTGAVTQRSAKLSWTPSGADDVLSYELTYTRSGGASTTRAINGTSTRLIGLDGNSTYEVSVRGRDAAGNLSPASAATTFSTSATPTGEVGPSVPEVFSDFTTDTVANVYWRTATDDTGVAGYDVLLDGVKVDRVEGNNKYLYTGLKPQTSYELQVIAYDVDGNATPGNKLTVRTGVANGGLVPKPVAYVSAVPLRTSLDVSWYGAEDDDPLQYELTLDGKVVLKTKALGYKIEGLTPSTEYVLGVRAVDPAGNYSPIVTSTYRTNGPAPTPTPTPTPLPPTASGPVATPQQLNYTCRLLSSNNVPVGIEYRAVQRGTSPRWDVTATIVVTPELAGALAFTGTASVNGKITTQTTFWGANGAKTQVPVTFTLPKQAAGSRWTSTTTVVGPVTLGNGPVAWTADLVDINLGILNYFGEPIVFPVDDDADGNPNTLDMPCGPLTSGADMRIKQLVVSGGGSSVIEATGTTTPTPTVTPTPTPTVQTPTPRTPTPTPGTPTPTPTLSPTPTPTPTPATPTPTGTPTPTPTPPVNCATVSGETQINYGYGLTGAATLKTLVRGSIPLTGSIAAKLGTPSGCFSADLTLARSSASLTALGFLPVTASVDIVPTQPVAGTLRSSVLAANAKVRIKLPKVSLLGVQIGGGTNCQAKQISSIDLKSTQAQFQATKGGPIAGTFAISDLAGCGSLNGLISPLTAGKGNAILLNLAPQG